VGLASNTAKELGEKYWGCLERSNRPQSMSNLLVDSLCTVRNQDEFDNAEDTTAVIIERTVLESLQAIKVFSNFEA
jgi:hypothetical protein